MRLIIKERKQIMNSNKYKLVIRESKTDLTGGAYEAQILPKDFKKLTDSAEHTKDVETRSKQLGSFDIQKAGKLILIINKDGQVVSHEGRARSLAAPEDQLLTVVVSTRPEGMSWEEIPEIIKNQFGTGASVEKSKVFRNVKKQAYESSLNVFRLIYKNNAGEETFYSGNYNKSSLEKLKLKETDLPREKPYKYVYVPADQELPNKSQEQQPPKFKVALFQQEDKLKHLQLNKYEDGAFKILDLEELRSNNLV